MASRPSRESWTRKRAGLDLRSVDAARRGSASRLSAAMDRRRGRCDYSSLRSNPQGVAFHRMLKPWQARTVIAKDPDENLLLFTEPADEELGRRRLSARSGPSRGWQWRAAGALPSGRRARDRSAPAAERAPPEARPRRPPAPRPKPATTSARRAGAPNHARGGRASRAGQGASAPPPHAAG